MYYISNSETLDLNIDQKLTTWALKEIFVTFCKTWWWWECKSGMTKQNKKACSSDLVNIDSRNGMALMWVGPFLESMMMPEVFHCCRKLSLSRPKGTFHLTFWCHYVRYSFLYISNWLLLITLMSIPWLCRVNAVPHNAHPCYVEIKGTWKKKCAWNLF